MTVVGVACVPVSLWSCIHSWAAGWGVVVVVGGVCQHQAAGFLALSPFRLPTSQPGM